MQIALLLSILLVPLIIVGTLAWWRIGDHWADNEHKRFKDRPTPTGTDGPRVVSSFESDPTPTPNPTPNPTPGDDGRPGS